MQTELIHIVLFLVLLITAFGIIIPTHPQLITQLCGNDVPLASSTYGKLTGLSSFLQFLLSPFYGALSDRIGRKKTLCIQLLLMTGFFVGLILANQNSSLLLAVVAQVFNGLSGNIIQTCMASIADISAPEKRAQSFGLAGVAFGIGFTVGPVIGGMLGNIERAFYVGSTIILVCSAYLITMYRETLTTFKKDGSLLSSANPLQSFGVLFQNKFTTRMSILLILINIANQGFFSSIIHYNQYRFKFDSKMNGIYMMAIGVGTAIVQGFFMRKIIPKLVFFACMSYTADKTAALALAVLFTVAGMADPIQQGLMSQEVKKEDQGKLQGGLSALALLCKVVAAVSMSSAFKYFTSDHAPVQLPSISFIFGTVLAIVSTFVVYSFPAKVDKEKSQ